MEQEDPKKLKGFLDGLLVFLELCGKHPDLTKEFIEKLQKAERPQFSSLAEIDAYIEKEANRRFEQLKKEGKIRRVDPPSKAM